MTQGNYIHDIGNEEDSDMDEEMIAFKTKHAIENATMQKNLFSSLKNKIHKNERFIAENEEESSDPENYIEEMRQK